MKKAKQIELEKEIRYCLFCDTKFIPTRTNQFYCSPKHRNRKWKWTTSNCKLCGNEYLQKKVNQDYCSPNCQRLNRLKENYVSYDIPKRLFVGTREQIVNNLMAWSEEKGFILDERENNN